MRDLDITLDLVTAAGIPPKTNLGTRLREARQNAYKRLEQEIEQWKHHDLSREWSARLDL